MSSQSNNYLFVKEAYDSVLSFWKAFQLPYCKAWIDSTPAARQLAAKLMQEEFSELLSAKSPVDKLDAYCDLLYVTLGAMPALGYEPSLLYIEAEYNFTGPLAETIKLIQEPGIVCHRRLQNSIPQAVMGITLTGKKSFRKFFEAFGVVHKANMSKLWSIAPADDSLVAIKSGDKWLVKRKEDGKIMKSPEFKHPNLEQYV